jgi:hypothetical protein
MNWTDPSVCSLDHPRGYSVAARSSYQAREFHNQLIIGSSTATAALVMFGNGNNGCTPQMLMSQ